MSTFDEMAEHILAEIASYVKNQESVTVLMADATSSDTVFQVEDVAALSKGTIEIGDELVYIRTVSQTESNMTAMTGGRGWRATSASPHPAGTLVRNNPTFPRSFVKRAINDTIKSLEIPAIKTVDFEFDGTTFAYPLPLGAEHVTGVSWDLPDVSAVWQRLTNYSLDRNYIVEGELLPRVAVVLGEAPMPGRTLRIQYTTNGTPLESGDDFTDSGFEESVEDVVKYGAMWRLVSTLETGRVSGTTVSGDALDSKMSSGAAMAAARYLYQLYTVRLEEERKRVLNKLQQSISYAR